MKKIIAIVAVIATITAILCIGTSAYNVGDVIETGTILTLKETPTNTQAGQIPLKFINEGINYTKYQVTYNPVKIYYGNTEVYNIDTGWTKSRIIKVTEDYIISDATSRNILTQSVESAEIPPLQKTIVNTKATFETTLTVATAIIAWLMANQIALVGLYLYILVALVATGKRFITGI